MTSDIEGVHRELAVGAERHSDLQQKSEAQLRQVQVSSLFMYIYSNIPYLEDVTVGMVASVDRWWQAHRQGGLNPPFGLQMILYTPLQFVNGPLASLALKITAVQMSLVSAMHPVFFFMED